MKKIIKYVLIICVFLLIISTILGIFVPFSQTFRIVFGSVYVLFLPGFIITFIFFPDKISKIIKIDWIERIALSFALSIAIVPLLVFYLNLIGVKINLLNVFLTILGVIIVSISILVFKKKIGKN